MTYPSSGDSGPTVHIQTIQKRTAVEPPKIHQHVPQTTKINPDRCSRVGNKRTEDSVVQSSGW
jgi:hypothetical protein